MLWICLYFPDLPLTVFERSQMETAPLAITSGEFRPLIVSANAKAFELGIRAGMPARAALALAPDAVFYPRDERSERQALANLALWAGQFTPACSIAAHALLLEVSGCITLFDGFGALIEKIKKGIHELGYKPWLAAAPTPTAATLFAHNRCEWLIADIEKCRHLLNKIPLATCGNAMLVALEALERLGIHTIGDCLKLPRSSFSRRFGRELFELIDRARGEIPDPQTLFEAPPQYTGRLVLPCPVEEVETLLFPLKRLTLELCGFLLGRGLGACQLRISLMHRKQITSLDLELVEPMRDGAALLQLWRERLSRLELSHSVEVLTLQSISTRALIHHNRELFNAHASAAELPLLDHLRARLGDAVMAITPHSDHRPECAWRIADGKEWAATALTAPRPLWLLPVPQAISSAALKEFLDGPERIEQGWWEGNDIERDYFVARMSTGEICWVYRDRRASQNWFLHGVFA